MQSESAESNRSSSFMRMLLTLMLVIWAGFLIIGTASPVLPRYVHHQLGFGTFAVGLVTGAQFAASLATRFAAVSLPLASICTSPTAPRQSLTFDGDRTLRHFQRNEVTAGIQLWFTGG